MMRTRMAGFLALSAAAMLLAPPVSARAEDEGIVITLKDQKFIPSDVAIPAGAKVKLVVRNQNATASEFESTELHREKIVQPGGEIVVFVGPLNPGSYEFFDDFHPETRGHLLVK